MTEDRLKELEELRAKMARDLGVSEAELPKQLEGFALCEYAIAACNAVPKLIGEIRKNKDSCEFLIKKVNELEGKLARVRELPQVIQECRVGLRTRNCTMWRDSEATGRFVPVEDIFAILDEPTGDGGG